MPEQATATGCVCSFCGHVASTRHGASIHRVRCAKNPERKVWSRTGVKNGQPRTKPREYGTEPTSVCHNAPVRTGRAHDSGNKYCTKCDRPCYWRANRPLPVSWSCKQLGCESQMHWREGYCKRHWEKRNKPREEDLDMDGVDAMI